MSERTRRREIIRLLAVLAGLVLLASAGVELRADPPPVDISLVLNPSRIDDGQYRLVLFNQDGDAISNQALLDRRIAREPYDGRPAIGITEWHIQGDTTTKTAAFVDAKTLAPLYVENSTDGRLSQKATFKDGTASIIDVDSGAERRSEASIGAAVYLSTSFSELVQATDFGRHRAVRFQTVSPGRAPNQFIAERDGEHRFAVSPRVAIESWIVRFSRVDAAGSRTPAGFRYVDKASGKVLAFKTELDSPKFFTYQILFLR